MKGLRASVYKSSYGNCSNGGLSSKVDHVTLVGSDFDQVFEADDSAPAVAVFSRVVGGKLYYRLEPVGPKPVGRTGYMFGGCFVYTSDSRFKFDYPLPLHDRTE